MTVEIKLPRKRRTAAQVARLERISQQPRPASSAPAQPRASHAAGRGVVTITCHRCGFCEDSRAFQMGMGGELPPQLTQCPQCDFCVQLDRVCGVAVVTIVNAGRPLVAP